MVHHSLQKSQGLVRLGAAALIAEMLWELGISADAAFGRVGLGHRLPPRPELVVPLARIGEIFRSARAVSGQAELGLLVGLRAGSREMSAADRAIVADAELTTTMTRIISRPPVFPHALMTLSVSGATSTVGCTPLPSSVIGRDLLADCVLGFAAGVLRVLCGPQWRAQHFHFAHASPSDPSRYTALLQAPILFNAKVTAMEFGTKWPTRERAPANDSALADAYLTTTEYRLHRDIIGELRAVLRSWNAVERPSAPVVSSMLGLQPRTLNRLLRRTSANFNQILGEIQYETARRLLQDPTMTVISVAWTLGYPDASTFSRAFRRWSGTTATEWRRQAVSKTQV